MEFKDILQKKMRDALKAAIMEYVSEAVSSGKYTRETPNEIVKCAKKHGYTPVGIAMVMDEIDGSIREGKIGDSIPEVQ